jgi:hypothetical protein
VEGQEGRKARNEGGEDDFGLGLRVGLLGGGRREAAARGLWQRR